MSDAAPQQAAPAAPEASKPANQQTSLKEGAKPEGLAEKASVATDAPAEEPKKHTPDPKVRAFAALTRKEREIKQLMASQKQEAAEIAELRQLRAQSSKDPVAWLKAGGLTYDQITKHFVESGGDPSGNPHETLQQEVAQARAELQQMRASLQQKEEARAVSNYIDDIKKTVSNDPDLELVAHYEAYADVYELIDLHYQKTGEILDKGEAARQIEDCLYQMKSDEAKKLLGAKKLRQQLGLPEREDPNSGSTEQPPGPPATGDTISNALAPSAGHRPPQRPLTDDERWEAMLARARGA